MEYLKAISSRSVHYFNKYKNLKFLLRPKENIKKIVFIFMWGLRSSLRMSARVGNCEFWSDTLIHETLEFLLKINLLFPWDPLNVKASTKMANSLKLY